MLKTIQMQKATPKQKQNKKPTHNAGKITKKKLKKPKFIGAEKKKISELSIKEKLEFLKDCLKNTIHGDLKAILYTVNVSVLKNFPTYTGGYIDMFKIVIKCVLLCLINNSTNSKYKDIVQSNNSYLLLKKICPDGKCKSSIDFESVEISDSIETELNDIADKYYDTFKTCVSKIVKEPQEITIDKYIKAIYPGGIAILTKNSDIYDLNINNIKHPIQDINEIINFINTKKEDSLIILKNQNNSPNDDVYNCMMQIIMKLVDIFSSDKNSKYYEMIINGTDENTVYLSMNEEAVKMMAYNLEAKALTTAQTTAQTVEAKALTTAQTTAQTAEAIAQTKAEAKVEEEAKEKAAIAKAIAAEAKEKAAKEKAEEDKKEKAKTAEIIKTSQPNNLDNLLNYIFYTDNNIAGFDLERHVILLKSLKKICYMKFNNLYVNFNEEINKKYIDKINEKNTDKLTQIEQKSKYDPTIHQQRCNSDERREAYQHIINILVPKYGLDITSSCYETLIALSEGVINNDCKTTIEDILTQKSYLLSEPTIIKVLLTEEYLNDLNNETSEEKLNKFKQKVIAELKKFKDKVLEILNEILDVPAYKDTQNKVLKIYNSLHDIIVTDHEGNRDLISVLVNDIENISRRTNYSNPYPNIQKTPEEIKFDELLDIVFKIFKDIKTITGNIFSHTKHGIILRSLKLICYNKLNKLFRNYSEYIDSKYITKLSENGFDRQNIESNASFTHNKTIEKIAGNQYCNGIQMIQAYQDIINILYQGQRKPNIEDTEISLLIDLSTGNLSPDCKRTISKIINEESYLLSESRIKVIELEGDFIITFWHNNKIYSSEDKAVLALTKYNETINNIIKKATIYDIKSKLWKDYDYLSKKIKLKYTNNSHIVEALPPINKPELPTNNRKLMKAQRIMATNIR